MQKCPNCGKDIPYTRPSWPRVYCSHVCHHEYQKKCQREVDRSVVILLTMGFYQGISTKAERLLAVDHLTSKGYSAKVIAYTLHVSERSVTRYRKQLRSMSC